MWDYQTFSLDLARSRNLESWERMTCWHRSGNRDVSRGADAQTSGWRPQGIFLWLGSFSGKNCQKRRSWFTWRMLKHYHTSAIMEYQKNNSPILDANALSFFPIQWAHYKFDNKFPFKQTWRIAETWKFNVFVHCQIFFESCWKETGYQLKSHVIHIDVNVAPFWFQKSNIFCFGPNV